jgi:hypothetical protein
LGVKLVLLAVEEVLGASVLLTGVVDELVTSAGLLDGFLPLEVSFVSFSVFGFEFFGRFV